METNSINNNGISTCQKGQEKYSQFCAGAFRGTIYYQYDYRHVDGELFSCIGATLEICREKRDKWLQKKRFDKLYPSTKEKLEKGKRLTKEDMAYEIGKVDPYHACCLYWDHLKRDDIKEFFNQIFGTEIEK